MAKVLSESVSKVLHLLGGDVVKETAKYAETINPDKFQMTGIPFTYSQHLNR